MTSGDGDPGDGWRPPLADVYELALSSLPDTVFLARASGDFHWVCPNVEDIFGWDAADVLDSQTVTSLLGDDRVPAALLDEGTELRENVETTVTDGDGETHHLLVTVRRLDNDEELFLYACRDVTERVSFRIELDQILNAVTDSFFSVDRELRITFSNDQFARTVGSTPEEIRGEYLWDLVSDAEQLRAFELLPQVLETGEAASYDGYYERSDIWYEVDIYPSTTGLSIYSKDVTDRKRQEQALVEGEQRFRALFEGTLDALLLADNQGRYIDVNPAGCELLGAEHDEIVGKTVADFAPAGFDFDAAWNVFLETGAGRGEFTIVRPDGEQRIAEFAATANIRSGEHLSVLRDVTDRVERDKLLEAQRDRLQHLNRVNELIRDVNQTLVGTTAVEEIYEQTCDCFVESEGYEAAAVVSLGGGETIDVHASSGLDSDRFDTVDSLVDGIRAADRDADPQYCALDAEEAQTLGLTGASFLVCLPISHAGTIYGILVVAGTAVPDEEREQELLEELAQTIGKAATAATARRLLHAESVVRLQFDVEDDADLYNTLSSAAEAVVTVVEIVPVETGRQVHYVTVDGASADEVVALAADLPGVERARPIETDNGVPTVELAVSRGSPAIALVEQGDHVVTARSDHGRGSLVVEISRDEDVRRVVRHLRRTYPRTTLVGKRHETHPPQTGLAEQKNRLTMARPNLTERQRGVLTAAYAAGYFTWPKRGTSGKELAESFDLSPTTFHQHLRVAIQKVLDAYLEAS